MLGLGEREAEPRRSFDDIDGRQLMSVGGDTVCSRRRVDRSPGQLRGGFTRPTLHLHATTAAAPVISCEPRRQSKWNVSPP